MKALTINNISKSYNKKTALKNISFEVDKGEIFGIMDQMEQGKQRFSEY